MKINNVKLYFLIIFSLLIAQSNEDQYVLLVSFDGFRYDYTSRLETPNFDYLEKWGTKSKSLKPIFPSFTFPNHYAIATGCYTNKHKIIGNEFSKIFDNEDLERYSYKNKTTVQDAKWYGAEPIWVTAEKNNLISATYFWVGSEAPIGGFYPTYYKNYKNGVNPKNKVDQVIEWFNLPLEERPRLVCLYFNEPDHAGHIYGADSEEVNEQIKKSDEVLGYLLKSLTKLDIFNKINLIVLSDHGMVTVSDDRVINIDDFNINGIIDGEGPIVSIKDTSQSKNLLNQLNIPNARIVSSLNNDDLHYHNPLFDYILLADEGWMIYDSDIFKKYNGKLPVKGMHGYDSNQMNMHAIFYAYGPKIKENLKIETFELIHIYPLICNILNITQYDDIDGSIDVLKPILR
ncbi:MAG: alkaline phosphatase family protein [Candidatus Marinimicrobia bacterium]|nr:alkaline phosphatase family protein [Candidatus Neomarinimicrobiota bacterium]|tara:strand:+ start:6771 stop:7976 length:1206 start_codon:yes stop_codon:yes gene_type:complete